MKKNKKGKLSAKIMAGFILLGVLVTAVTCFIGYNRYTAVMEKLYNDKAYQIAYSAIEYIDGDKVEEYFKEIKACATDEERAAAAERISSDEKYQRVLALISSLRSNMNANYIYIADMRTENGIEAKLTYLMDADNPNDSFEPFVPGDTSPMNADFLNDAKYIYDTAGRPDNYFYSHSAFGYNTSAIAPIQNSAGKVVGIVGVEIAMENLQGARTAYILYAALFSALVTAAVVVLMLFAVKKTLLTPIKTITDEADDFAENEARVSEKLGLIKTNDEIETLAGSILQMERNIREYIDNITAITAEKERIGAELSVASQIQSDMLPSIFPAFPENGQFDIYAHMDPAKEVGGDFYDFFLVDDDHLAVVIADVSGKGVPAALFMVIAKTLIKNHAQSGESPADIFTNVNAQLCESNKEGMFVTAWLGILTLSTGELKYVNAGHNPPLIRRNDGGYGYFKTRPGFVLAGMEGIKYRQGETVLEKGESLFLYTDGITEATNGSDQLYGEDRLLEMLNANADVLPTELLPVIRADIDKFVDGAPQFDDITMLSLKYCGEKGE